MRTILSLLFASVSTVGLLGQSLPSKPNVVATLKLVNDYWMSQNPTPGNNQWARATYFTGNIDFYKVYPKSVYLDYANLWASNSNWALNGGTSTRNADNQTCGQVYIDLYNIDEVKVDSKIAAIKSSIDKMVAGSTINDWWWVDALYMAMPVFARLGELTGNDAYINRMYQMYADTKVTRGLYNSTEGLWYRDESFKPPYLTPNGADSYWARGNGWVLAAHARILQMLPLADPHRPEYIDTFQKMAAALKIRQREDGFWNVSLDDPSNYGGPETSGTAFFTYGMAWGINNGLLDKETYLPVVQKAWNALATVAVQPNGFLGYVQGVGTNPASSQPVTVASTADFGVGAFLLAGTEVVKLAEGDMPVPSNFGMTAASVVDKGHIKVVFNNPVDLITALKYDNYGIDNGVSVESVSVGDQPNSIILTVSDIDFGRYLLQVANIKNQAGLVIDLGEKITFVYSGVTNVTSSGFEAGTSNMPDKTLDFDFSTRWSADGNGQWILYDLGESRLVTSVDLAFYKGNERMAYFAVSLSQNGTDFTEVFNGQSSGTTLLLENFDFADRTARYVKITGYGNSASTWNSITETRINWSLLTSVKPVGFNNGPMTVYPNPLKNGSLTVSVPVAEQGETSVAVTDLSGRVVYQRHLGFVAGPIVLNDLTLSKGVYLVVASSARSRTSTILLVE